MNDLVPGAFVAGLFAVTVAGAVLAIRTEQREDYPILAIAAAVIASLFGAWCLAMMWTAVLVAVPVRVGWGWWWRRRGHVEGPSAAWSLRWLVITAAACTVGLAVGGGLYVAVFGRSFPATLDTLADALVALVSITVAWVGTMTVVVLAARRVAGPLIPRGLDPFDTLSVPYVLPLMGGFPLVAAAVALYQPAAPWSTLLILLWCFPLYGATVLDRYRRGLAQDLRRDALAAQRLAAIGEVSARLVHQSRHQVGLMGWSIHRLRHQVDTAGSGGSLDLAVVHAELDELGAAKDRLSRLLTSDVLHEGAPGEAPAATDGTAASGGSSGSVAGVAVGKLVGEVAGQLRAEAEREEVVLTVSGLDSAVARRRVPAVLTDVVFNLIDNAIDAARREVAVSIAGDDGRAGDGLVVRVSDDGPGLTGRASTQAFEPFFTTKADGTGMGLAIADALVGDLGGELEVSRREQRTVFEVRLPIPPRVAVPPSYVK